MTENVTKKIHMRKQWTTTTIQAQDLEPGDLQHKPSGFARVAKVEVSNHPAWIRVHYVQDGLGSNFTPDLCKVYDLVSVQVEAV